MAQARKVKRKPSETSARGPTPGWVWLFAGMVVGLGIAAVFYLQGADRMGQQPSWLTDRSAATGAPPTSTTAAAPAAAPPRAAAPAPVPTSQAPTPAPAAAPSGSTAPSAARFQFYEMLPQDEITVQTPASRTVPSTQPPPAQTIARPSERIVLQTGSFRQFAQADEMKARLALMGLQANIREVRVNGENFHRVYVGPFDNEAQANRTLERLRRENIDAMRLPTSG